MFKLFRISSNKFLELNVAEMSDWKTAGNFKSAKTKYLHTGLSEDLEAYSKEFFSNFVHFLSHRLQRRLERKPDSTRHSFVDEAADEVPGGETGETEGVSVGLPTKMVTVILRGPKSMAWLRP